MDFLEVVRQFRIGPLAVVDTAVAYFGVFLISPWLTKGAVKVRLRINKAQWLWLVLPIGIAVHIIFSQRTPLTEMFVDPNSFYLVKMVILFMLFMGIKDIRFIKK